MLPTMDAVTIYRQFILGGRELVQIDGVWMIKQTHYRSGNITHTKLNTDRDYQTIERCIQYRNENPDTPFKCSCTYCSASLLDTLYKKLYLPHVSINKDEQILESAIEEFFGNQHQDTSPKVKVQPVSQVQTQIQSSIHPCTNECFPFGKYRGKSFKEVFDTDKNYSFWCIESLAIERSQGKPSSPAMVNFVAYCKWRIVS
jgi:hypothetical protein